MSALYKDVLDHLCATDPHWTAGLQVLQLARRQASNDASATAHLLCAIILLASDAPDPQAFLEHCANSLRHTPLGAR